VLNKQLSSERSGIALHFWARELVEVAVGVFFGGSNLGSSLRLAVASP